MNKFHPLVVSKITKLTESAVKITFEVPELLKKVYSFEAGEYLTLQQTIDNQKIRRAYSICSGVNENELSVAVKRVPDGIFSTYATTRLKEGDTIEVLSSQGSFVFFHDIFGNKDIMLFSAGSGVTPMMSIAKTALAKTNIKVVFVYGNKSKDETLFFDEIETLKKLYPERFLVHYVFSQQNWGDHFSGRINDQIIDIIFEKYKDLNWGRYYICGPAQMVKNTRDNILCRDISQDRIFTELFEAESKGNDYSELEGNVKISVTIEGKQYQFEAPRNQALLNVILQQKIDAPYSCLNGVCSSCIGKITEGTAKMAKNETLTEQEINQDYILTCQAYSMHDCISISYDI